MSPEIHYCPVVVQRARMYEDPEPEELCENEVAEEGTCCNAHDDIDPDYAYEEYKEAQREGRHGNDY